MDETKKSGKNDAEKKMESREKKETPDTRLNQYKEKAERDLAMRRDKVRDTETDRARLKERARAADERADAVAEVGGFMMTAGMSEATDFTTKTSAKKQVLEEKTVAAEKPADTAADQAKAREQKIEAIAKEQPREGTAAQGAKRGEGAR